MRPDRRFAAPTAFVAGVLATACVSGDALQAPLVATSFLVVDVDQRAVWGYADALPDRVWRASERSRLFILAYDVPLATFGIVAGEDGVVAVAPVDAPSRDRWPFPPGARTQRYDGAAHAWVDGGALADELAAAGLYLLRERCPYFDVRRVRVDRERLTFPDRGVSTLLADGDRVLGGDGPAFDERSRRPSYLFEVTLTSTEAKPLAPPAPPDVPYAFVSAPRFFRDQGVITLLWGTLGPTAGGLRARLYTLTSSDTFHGGPRLGPTVPGNFNVTGLAVGTFDGRTELAVIGDNQTLFVRNATTGTFDAIAEGPAAPRCDVATHTQILELTGPGRGLAGFIGAPVRAFDRARSPVLDRETYGPPFYELACRSARAFFSSGDELFAWASPPLLTASPTGIAWRRTPTSPWVQLEVGEAPSGAVIHTRGELAFVGVDNVAGGLVSVYQRDPRWPDLPPRHCQDLNVGIPVHQLASIPGGVLAGGAEGGLAWLIEN